MAGADSDGDMISNVLVLQHVPVVGSVTLDKLQFLLHSLCDRIASQAWRLQHAKCHLIFFYRLGNGACMHFFTHPLTGRQHQGGINVG